MKRIAIITGGTKGLGREIALAFGRAGYSVVVFYSSDDAAAEQLKLALARAGMAGSIIRHDVSSEDAAIWNCLEIQDAESITLIHNACASFSPTPMHQLSWADFEKNLRVAVKGAWLCSRALIRPMLKMGQGTVVNVLTSAIDGNSPKGFAAYATAKHALRGFSLALAAEYADRGLRIFTVSPGFMDTPLTESWDERLREMIRTHSPRITDPVAAARRLVEMVSDPAIPGRGEDYPI